jgi:hypothetical protein
MAYPKFMYHRNEEPRIFQTEEELAEAGPGWEETPAAFEDEETYQEHMAEWESKEEKSTRKRKKAE